MTAAETYSTKDLCARYNCHRATLIRKREDGYPIPDYFGHRSVYNGRKVRAWERVHMPHLHDDDSRQYVPEIIDDGLERMHAQVRAQERLYEVNRRAREKEDAERAKVKAREHERAEEIRVRAIMKELMPADESDAPTVKPPRRKK